VVTGLLLGGNAMKWEYRTVSFGASSGFWPLAAGGEVGEAEITTKLNGLGRDGWELVSAVATDDIRGQTRAVVCILKRPFKN
jgi:hypothetical protein